VVSLDGGMRVDKEVEQIAQQKKKKKQWEVIHQERQREKDIS